MDLKIISAIHRKRPVLEFLFSRLVLFFKEETPTEVFSRAFFKIFDKNVFKEQFRAAASMTSEFILTDKNIFKVGKKATNILISLSLYLDMLLCI